jgi:predicted PurR-regulated permease PerM/methylmalonyl-CoA mutase cobalamin-binding subunit
MGLGAEIPDRLWLVMKEATSQVTSFHIYSDDDFDASRAARPILAVIIATAVFALARTILLPLAMASILAVIFSPVASRLERYVGRLASAALVVLAAIAALAVIGYFVTVQLTAVALEVADYSNNIAAKLTAVEKSTPFWLQRIEHAVGDIERQVQKASPKATVSKPAVVQAVPTSPAVGEVIKPVIPVLSAIADAGIVIALLFFLLYGRRDLRDRFVRLAVRARITVAAQVIETAGDAVGRYLLLVSLTNLGFGITIGIVVWLLGLPNPEFWGVLAFLLRFIPYVGALTAAVLPTLVAVAVFPGWSKAFEVLGSFLILDQTTAQVVEPLLIGHGIGVSPVALLVSAMYWAWLWGPVGLLLSAPLTACLKVAGDYIAPLGFLSILLGDESASEDYHEYYRRLLELDQAGAGSLATRYCDEHGLEPVFNDVIVPALILMGEERAEDHISQENQQFIVDTTREIVIELGNRVSKPRATARLRILGVCPNGEAHSLGLLILLELLRQDGAAATFTGENKSPDEVRAFVRRFAPDLVCVSCTVAECLPSAVELIRSLKADSPGLTIIAGGKAAVSAPSELLAAGCSQIFRRRAEARRAVRRYASQRKLRPARAAEPHPIPNGTATPSAGEARPLTGSGGRS